MSSLPAGEAGTITIGGDVTVSRMGFGAMRVRGETGVEVLRRAVRLGIDFLDTADVYGPETSERLIADALHPYPEGLVIATKGGIRYDRGERDYDGRPEYLRAACEASLRRLRVERIDVYQLHRHDPDVPIEESVGGLADLQREGKIRHIGLSNVSVDQLTRARAVAEIATVQNEYSRWFRLSEEVLEACEEHGIGFMAWGPLGDSPYRDPVFELRWLLDRSPVMLPIPGTSSVEHLEENMRAARR
jgi:aryl-alcohol dehydrogenase-like predicted oxidoreductase